MQITELQIRNFKSIQNLHISQVENALILVGKNNTGKTAVLDAIRSVSGAYQIQLEDFQEDFPNIEISVVLAVTKEDLHGLHEYLVLHLVVHIQGGLYAFRLRLVAPEGIGDVDASVIGHGSHGDQHHDTQEQSKQFLHNFLS